MRATGQIAAVKNAVNKAGTQPKISPKRIPNFIME